MRKADGWRTMGRWVKRHPILIQAGLFCLAYSLFFARTSGPDDTGYFLMALLFYVTWIPAFHGDLLGGMWAYLVLTLLVLGLAVSL
ncbi:MAG: hypothetical protein AAF492_26315, partial [Verrucomicrobiota bacterium]